MAAPLFEHLRSAATHLDRFAARLTTHEAHLATQLLFKNLFFGWLFLHTMLLVPFHRDIWAPESFMVHRPFAAGAWYDWIFNLSALPALRPYYELFVLAQMAVLALGIAGVAPRLMNLLACVLTLNVNNLAPVILDGGNNLAQLILIYMLFLNTSGRPFRSRWACVQMAVVAISNAAFLLCRLQVVIVYVCTAIYKLNGPLWQNGMALYYILQSDTYTHPLLYRTMMRQPWTSMLGSYFTMAAQALVPVLVWPRRTRPFILTAAALTHLGISFGMGLFTFGLVMCVMYTLFFTDALSRRLIELFSPSYPLSVSAGSDRRALLGFLRRLDWLRALVFVNAEDASAPLTVHAEERSATFTKGAALLRIMAKIPIFMPLMPLLGVLHYVGILDLACRRRPAVSGQRQTAGSAG